MEHYAAHFQDEFHSVVDDGLTDSVHSSFKIALHSIHIIFFFCLKGLLLNFVNQYKWSSWTLPIMSYSHLLPRTFWSLLVTGMSGNTDVTRSHISQGLLKQNISHWNNLIILSEDLGCHPWTFHWNKSASPNGGPILLLLFCYTGWNRQFGPNFKICSWSGVGIGDSLLCWRNWPFAGCSQIFQHNCCAHSGQPREHLKRKQKREGAKRCQIENPHRHCGSTEMGEHEGSPKWFPSALRCEGFGLNTTLASLVRAQPAFIHIN